MILKVNEDISVNIQCDDIGLEQNKVKDKLCDKCKGGVDDMMKDWDRLTDRTPIDEVTLDDIDDCVWGYYCEEDSDCSDYLTQIVNLELVNWKGIE